MRPFAKTNASLDGRPLVAPPRAGRHANDNPRGGPRRLPPMTARRLTVSERLWPLLVMLRRLARRAYNGASR